MPFRFELERREIPNGAKSRTARNHRQREITDSAKSQTARKSQTAPGAKSQTARDCAPERRAGVRAVTRAIEQRQAELSSGRVATVGLRCERLHNDAVERARDLGAASPRRFRERGVANASERPRARKHLVE